MCTLTIIPLARERGARLAFNRDELKSRPTALAPQVRRFGLRSALLPIDPVSDGTWIGVNDAGLAAAVLNVNELGQQPQSRDPWTSRGVIVPALLRRGCVDAAFEQARTLRPEYFAPFRLVIVDRSRWGMIRSDGRLLRVHEPRPLDQPVFFTSSGLGDQLVEAPRRALFETAMGSGHDAVSGQVAFHRHRWTSAPHLSVLMNRPDAATVSITTIKLTPIRVTLRYQPLGPVVTDAHESSLVVEGGGVPCTKS